MIKRTLLAALVVLGVSAPAAAAAAPPSETVTMTWTAPYVVSAPYATVGSGIFTASGPINASGSLSVGLHLGAAVNPGTSVLNAHGDRILTDASGYTVTLRCNESPHKFGNANPAAIPLTGNCTVISGTGPYAGLHAQGQIVSPSYFDSTGPEAFVKEVVQF